MADFFEKLEAIWVELWAYIKNVLAYDVECFLRKLKDDEYSSSMISKVRGLLHQSLRSAEANNLIPKNPVPLIDKMRKCM